jgi:hypothetical protein
VKVAWLPPGPRLHPRGRWRAAKPWATTSDREITQGRFERGARIHYPCIRQGRAQVIRRSEFANKRFRTTPTKRLGSTQPRAAATPFPTFHRAFGHVTDIPKAACAFISRAPAAKAKRGWCFRVVGLLPQRPGPPFLPRHIRRDVRRFVRPRGRALEDQHGSSRAGAWCSTTRRVSSACCVTMAAIIHSPRFEGQTPAPCSRPSGVSSR